MRENELKQQIEEAKSWAHVVKEPLVEQKETIERQIREKKIGKTRPQKSLSKA